VVLLVPQIRADQCLGALRVGLLNPDQEAQLGHLAGDLAGTQQLGIIDDLGLSIDAEGVAHPRNQEQQGDPRVVEQVGHGVREPVAGSLGQQQRAFVEHLDEARRIASRGDVQAAIGAGCGHAHERRVLDELPGQLVDVVAQLGPDDLGRLTDDIPQACLIADRGHGLRIRLRRVGHRASGSWALHHPGAGSGEAEALVERVGVGCAQNDSKPRHVRV
jgi:hypothetical protein